MEDEWRQVKEHTARKDTQKHEKVWSVQPLTVFDGLTVSAGLRRSGESAERVSQTLWSWKKLRLSPDNGERDVTLGRGRHGHMSKVPTALNT